MRVANCQASSPEFRLSMSHMLTSGPADARFIASK
jgi:hypothetical protein